MSRPLLDLSEAPEDPIERLMWLSGVKTQVEREMDEQWQQAYFWARFTGRMDVALDLGYHSRKRIMAFTRAGNEKAGRMIRWGDGQG